MIILGIIWTATSLMAAVRVDLGLITEAEDLRNHMTSGVRNLVVGVILILLFRKRIFANRANRRLVYLFWTMLAVVAFFRWSTWYLEADLFLARIGDMMTYVLALMAVGLMSDVRICFIASAFGVGAILSVIWPEWVLYFNTAATALTFAGFAWIWRPGKARATSKGDKKGDQLRS
jgi:eukaryotic-like serine/threonine-protein kinase